MCIHLCSLYLGHIYGGEKSSHLNGRDLFSASVDELLDSASEGQIAFLV